MLLRTVKYEDSTCHHVRFPAATPSLLGPSGSVHLQGVTNSSNVMLLAFNAMLIQCSIITRLLLQQQRRCLAHTAPLPLPALPHGQ